MTQPKYKIKVNLPRTKKYNQFDKLINQYLKSNGVKDTELIKEINKYISDKNQQVTDFSMKSWRTRRSDTGTASRPESSLQIQVLSHILTTPYWLTIFKDSSEFQDFCLKIWDSLIDAIDKYQKKYFISDPSKLEYRIAESGNFYDLNSLTFFVSDSLIGIPNLNLILKHFFKIERSLYVIYSLFDNPVSPQKLKKIHYFDQINILKQCLTKSDLNARNNLLYYLAANSWFYARQPYTDKNLNLYFNRVYVPNHTNLENELYTSKGIFRDKVPYDNTTCLSRLKKDLRFLKNCFKAFLPDTISTSSGKDFSYYISDIINKSPTSKKKIEKIEIKIQELNKQINMKRKGLAQSNDLRVQEYINGAKDKIKELEEEQRKIFYKIPRHKDIEKTAKFINRDFKTFPKTIFSDDFTQYFGYINFDFPYIYEDRSIIDFGTKLIIDWLSSIDNLLKDFDKYFDETGLSRMNTATANQVLSEYPYVLKNK